MPVRILFVSANAPTDLHLDIEREQRGVQNSLMLGKYRDQFAVILAPAIRPEDLPTRLSNESPAVVHFSGHGLQEGVIFRESNIAISGPQLAEALTNRNVRLVVLNSCFSLDQAEAISNVVPSVVGTKKAVSDNDAVRFSEALYRGLADGRTVGEAFRDAKDAVGLTGGQDVFKALGDMNQTFGRDVVVPERRWFRFAMSITISITIVLVAAIAIIQRDRSTTQTPTPTSTPTHGELVPDPREEPSIVQPQSLAGLGGQQPFQCQLPNPSARPAAVHVWAVPYRNAAHTEWNNGPAYAPQLAQSINDPFAWTGTVDIDSAKIAPYSFGFGHFFLCHASFAGDPILDAARSGAITTAAKKSGRTMDR